MLRKANEIVVEWLESKDAEKRHRVNIKHIIGKLAEVAVGGEVVIKLNLRCYRAKIVDLLDWTPREKKRAAEKKKTKQQVSKQCVPSYYILYTVFLHIIYYCVYNLQCVTYV